MKILLITSGYNSLAQKLLFDDKIELIGIAFPCKNIKNQSIRHKFSFSIRHNYFRVKRLLSNAKKLPNFIFSKENENEFLDWIKTLKPDLIISYSSPFLFDQKLLALPPKGVINVHNSLLPKYRGPQPIMWQYLDYDLIHGVTIHYLGEKEDSGDILLQQSFEIKNGSSHLQTIEHCEKLGYELLVRSIQLIKKGKVKRIKQPVRGSTKRAKRLSADEIRQLIKWNEWSPEHINHVIKGLQLPISDKEVEQLSHGITVKNDATQLASTTFLL
ncbi:hypothetical protein C3K47_12210 [Solitalea longa]|uniref:PH domain-containing protein n=1 Tax=Solitalea longa TaxID=2079460 RepID=A0A2S5A097_9SPHI|nr:formyltransferase family protein [Solitalea longa]POY35964.1 hypothetical protein C3K47_12210 [Solitalea longa]